MRFKSHSVLSLFQICRGCNTEIGPGEKAVCSNYEKQAVYWHQHCFKCKSCNETIVDYIYFWHENEIFCGRHFAEKYRPRCAGCDEVYLHKIQIDFFFFFSGLC